MTFRDLHYGGDLPLLLPNAWDVASALAFADAGFRAVGTTSFGVAAAAGEPDGGRASRDATRALVRRLAGIPVHVTADIEDGYTEDPEQVADYAAGLGADGVNLEDSSAGRLIDPALHAAKVAAVKRRAPGLFVNARVDTYWLGQDAGVESSLARALAYVEAGADGIFFPGAAAPDDLRILAARTPVPVNVLLVPGLTLHELAGLGVRRVSTGSLPYRAAIDAAVAVATDARAGRTPPPATPYATMQQRLTRHQARA
ncbi:isocitrate lyase/PEP mutase family protein [Streptomyces sp. IBSBF 2435]|uniref:isocitrate lyase/PEP mutase family protein n=1 Tax=Streptomyces sp. IBSBF 2435 TaxID=2903531 RepID=UPI002FDBDAD6